jgi:hypothetical protein
MQKQRGGRGLVSAFGLALVAMLVFGALAAGAAQASPTWYINGKTLAERGETKAAQVISGGTLSLEVPNWNVTVSCGENLGSGYVVGQSGGDVNLTASNCGVVGNPACEVDPIEMGLNLALGGSVVETFVPSGYEVTDLTISGAQCSWPYAGESVSLYYVKGSLGVDVTNKGTGVRLTETVPPSKMQAAIGKQSVYIALGGLLQQQTATGAELEVW